LGGDFEAVLTYFAGLRRGQPAPPVQPNVSTIDLLHQIHSPSEALKGCGFDATRYLLRT
jgi:hypothetical protein